MEMIQTDVLNDTKVIFDSTIKMEITSKIANDESDHESSTPTPKTSVTRQGKLTTRICTT